MFELLQIILVGLRFVVPPLMLWFPIPGVLATLFLDVVDGDLLGWLGMSEESYQFIDKIADYYGYIFMMILGLRWPIRNILAFLLAFRSIGQLIFLLTNERLVLVAFPNFFEALVLVFVGLLIWRKTIDRAYQTYRHYLWQIWAFIITLKILNEWQLHFAQISISNLLFGISGH